MNDKTRTTEATLRQLSMATEENALMPLTDLRDRLRREGIIDVPRSTVRNWYLFGVSTGSGRIKLKTKKVGNRRMSSVSWTKEFLSQQED